MSIYERLDVLFDWLLTKGAIHHPRSAMGYRWLFVYGGGRVYVGANRSIMEVYAEDVEASACIELFAYLATDEDVKVGARNPAALDRRAVQIESIL